MKIAKDSDGVVRVEYKDRWREQWRGEYDTIDGPHVNGVSIIQTREIDVGTTNVYDDIMMCPCEPSLITLDRMPFKPNVQKKILQIFSRNTVAIHLWEYSFNINTIHSRCRHMYLEDYMATGLCYLIISQLILCVILQLCLLN